MPQVASVSLPDSIVSIKKYAFRGCQSIESIEITKNVAEIGVKVFDECPQLKTVSIPEGLVYPLNAFPENTNITSTH